MGVGAIREGGAGVATALTKVAGTVTYDPRDTNQDGVVSAEEEQAYAQRFPPAMLQASGSAGGSPSVSSYTAAGAVDAASRISGLAFDGYA